MDFGSKYVYKYAHSEEESVSDDEDNALGNDNEQLFIPRNRTLAIEENQMVAATDDASAVSHKRKRLRKPDTNVVSIKFNRLLQPSEMHAGDAVICEQCGAIASHLSKIQKQDDDDQSQWQCEFCLKSNTVDIEQTDLPRQEDATYLITPAPVVHGSDMSGIDDSMVFFLIDISGSMSSTTLVQGTFNLPNALKQQERAAEAFGGAHMIRQRHQTYVTRLQGVQMAVDANLDKLVKDTPTRRAALLTFNHELTYYGDGTRDEPLVIRGDKLNNPNDLLHEAEREADNELKSVAQTKIKLTERIYDLEEGGQTALGPAVVFALNIASRRQGSKIVICTDGLANRGLGSLETAQDEKADEAVKLQALEEGNHFYAELTENARAKGVSISVITIKGTACLLPVIGQMADGTGGNVTIVDLLNLRDEFASILDQQVIASNVEATLIVHRGLYIRNLDNPDEKLEKIKRDIGNVTKQTEITFEYGIRNKEETKEKYQIDLDQLQQLPFQIQVTYTAVDGSKAMRVLTQLKETTDNREVAEVNAVRSVIAENHIRSTANDMMVTVSDEEEEEAEYGSGSSRLVRTKYATPVVQKQRLAYMDNLNTKVRSRCDYQTDQFNERRWNKASNELQTHVVSSRARRTITPRSTVPIALPPPPPHSEDNSSSGSIFGIFGNKVARLFTGSTKGASAEPKTVATSAVSTNSSKRNYGFATSNLSLFTDQHSENLYRYKNISSDYMREESPPRNDNNNDDDARLPSLPAPRRPVVRRQHDKDDDNNNNNNNEPSAFAAYPTRAAMRQARRDERPIALPDTARFEPKTEEKIDTKPIEPANTEQNEPKSNDGDNDEQSERL